MPYYDYACLACSHEWNEFQKISTMEVPMKAPCPSCSESGSIERRMYSVPMMIDNHKLGRMKPDQGFQDVLRRIHDRSPGSKLNETSNIVQI